MPKRTLPRIADVAPGKAPLTLRVRWQHGGESLVDVSGLVSAFRVYAPPREDRALFRRVRVGEHGTDVTWTDEIDVAADMLWRLGAGAIRGNLDRRSVPRLAGAQGAHP